MFRLMSFYGNDEIKFRKIGDFAFDSECSRGLLPGAVNSNESSPGRRNCQGGDRGLPVVPVHRHQFWLLWPKDSLTLVYKKMAPIEKVFLLCALIQV
jgi:hypothetical protein